MPDATRPDERKLSVGGGVLTWRHSGVVDQFHGPDARHVIFNDWDDPWTDTALALVSHIKGRIGTPFRCDLVVGLPSDLGLTQVTR